MYNLSKLGTVTDTDRRRSQGVTACDRDSRQFCGKAERGHKQPVTKNWESSLVSFSLLFLLLLLLFLCSSPGSALVPASTMHRLSSASSSAVRRSAAKAAKPVLKRGAHKEIKFSNEGRASILTGVDVLANAVSVTLGPKGEYFLSYQTPTFDD